MGAQRPSGAAPVRGAYHRGVTIRRRFLGPALVAGALLALSPLAPARAAAYEVRVEQAVVYGTAPVGAPAPGRASLLMDVYRPVTASRRRRPAAILVHGGGFVSGSRRDLARSANALAARGIIAASIDYRLTAQAPTPTGRFARLAAAMEGARLGPAYPDADAVAAAAEDAGSALDYLRRNASRLGVRTSRIGLLGSSAGAVTVDNVAYVAPNYGIRVPKLRFVASLWGGMIVPTPGGRAAVNNLGRGDPPLFLVHGDADRTVPVGFSDAMSARARSVKVPAEYHRLAGAGHGWSIASRPTASGQSVFDRLIDYAARRLR